MSAAQRTGIVGIALATALLGPATAMAAVDLTGTSAGLAWGTAPSIGGALSISTSGLTSGGSFVDSFSAVTIGGSSPTFADPALGVDVNVSGNVVTVTENPSVVSTSFTSAALLKNVVFNGFVLLDQSIKLTSASLANSSVSGFNASDVQTANGGLWINLAGLTVQSGQQISIDLAQGTLLSAVPEPPLWWLIIVSAGVLGTALRLRRPRRVALT